MSRTNVYHQTAAGPSQNQLPPFDILTDEHGVQQTTSPRSEFLSSSTERGRTAGTHASSSRRRHRRRTSEKHSRTKDAPGDTSQRELLRIVLKQEVEADNLKKVLRTTLQQLDEESQKVVEYERGTKEAAERFKKINDSRIAAEKNAIQTNQQLHLYEFQLQNAQKEIMTAQETLRLLEKQKGDAEELAARARARARKLHQRQIVLEAKEEGRRLGFEAGIKQAQDELLISATARRAVAQERPHHSSRRKERQQVRSSQPPSPPPEYPAADSRDGDDHLDDDEQFQEDETMDPQEYERDGDSETLRSPVIVRTHTYPLQNEGTLQPSTYDSTMRASASLPQPSSSQHPDPRAPSPVVQVYSLKIPNPEQISSHPTHRPPGWVTAQEHRDINGSQTSPNTSRRSMPPEPVQNPAGPAAHSTPQRPPGQVVMERPPLGSMQPPVPIMPIPYGDRPHPLKSTGSAKKILRFPSMAKSKAQSWYRSFSLRKKTKPVIDPIEEEPPAPQENPTTDGSSGELYKFQPAPPTTWYPAARKSADNKSQKSHVNLLKPHSRAASIDDRGGDRVSRASTRFSQLDMISSAPNRYQGDAPSLSGRSTQSKNVAQKLSIIKEDSQSRGSAPLTGQYSASNKGPIAFALPRDDPHARKRPSEIIMPPPPKFDPNDPFVQGNHHLFPNGIPNWAPPQMFSAPSTGQSASININVRPATAAFDQPTNAISMASNHLNLNYVYHPSTVPSLAPGRDPLPVNWDPVTPSNASHTSRQSRAHRHTQSYDNRPHAYPDTQSIRSHHSRAASAMGQAGQELYPQDLRAMAEPHQPRPSSRMSRAQDPVYHSTPRATSIRSSGSRNPARDSRAELLGDRREGIRRIPSRSSMHSKYDPNTYVDPAFFEPDGSADPSALHTQRMASPSMRPASRASSLGLEYV